MLGGREFSSFRSQLLSLPDIRESLIEISQPGDNTSWANIAAKQCQESLFCNFDNNCIKLRIDEIDGCILQEQCSHGSEGPEASTNQNETPQEEEGPDLVPKGFTNVDSGPSKVVTAAKNDEVEMAQQPVDFSTLHELNWGENKKN